MEFGPSVAAANAGHRDLIGLATVSKGQRGHSTHPARGQENPTPDVVPSRSKAYTATPLNFFFDGSSPATPSAWNPNDTSAPAAIVPFQSAFLIT